MIPGKLIEAVVIFILMVAATGHLPRLVQAVQIAQWKVLKASQSSNWGEPLLLPVKK